VRRLSSPSERAPCALSLARRGGELAARARHACAAPYARLCLSRIACLALREAPLRGIPARCASEASHLRRHTGPTPHRAHLTIARVRAAALEACEAVAAEGAALVSMVARRARLAARGWPVTGRWLVLACGAAVALHEAFACAEAPSGAEGARPGVLRRSRAGRTRRTALATSPSTAPSMLPGRARLAQRPPAARESPRRAQQATPAERATEWRVFAAGARAAQQHGRRWQHA